MNEWLDLHIYQVLLIVYISILSGCTGKVYKKFDLFSPWTITNIVWTLILFFFIFWGEYLYQLKTQFYTALLLWITFFNLFSVIQFDFTTKFHGKNIFNVTIYNILIVVLVVLMPIYFYKIYLSIGGSFTNLAYTIRITAQQGNLEIGVLKYIRSLASALMIVSLWRWENNKKTAVFLVIANILMGLSIMEKGTFFTILVVIIFIFYCKKKISLKTITILALCFLAFSFFFNVLRQRDIHNEISFINFFSIYITSPSVAFETLEASSSAYFGESTFPFFYKISNALGLTDIETVSKVKEFVWVPVYTNVYTVMAQYFVDFGYPGVAIFASINGFINGFVYKKCLTGSSIMKCLYSYLLSLLLLQFFQENFFVSISVVIQHLIIFFLLYSSDKIKLNHRFSHVR